MIRIGGAGSGPFSRRRLLTRGLKLGGGAVAASMVAHPSVVMAERSSLFLVRSDRPVITHGVQSGDVTATGAVVWARTDRPGRMVVEVGATESLRRPRRFLGPVADEAGDFTAQVDLYGLPSGQDVFYRVRFQNLDDARIESEAVVGHFRTAPARTGDVSLVWSGDTAGQGWGINPDVGGMTIYETMRGLQPDFFIHSGDTVYADGPIEAEVPLSDGGVCRNVTTEEKAKVAETLAQFRGNHKYNLLDDNVRRFNAEVPVFAQWDDHETTNNWYPGEILDDPRYSVTDVDVLAARAKQAFQEFMPIRQAAGDSGRIYRSVAYGPSLELFFLDMRTHRGPNSANDQPTASASTALLGE